jgi:hypothetical protein
MSRSKATPGNLNLALLQGGGDSQATTTVVVQLKEPVEHGRRRHPLHLSRRKDSQLARTARWGPSAVAVIDSGIEPWPSTPSRSSAVCLPSPSPPGLHLCSIPVASAPLHLGQHAGCTSSTRTATPSPEAHPALNFGFLVKEISSNRIHGVLDAAPHRVPAQSALLCSNPQSSHHKAISPNSPHHD